MLTPEPGIYAGTVRVDKPLAIDGRDQVTIDGGGKGTVVLLETGGATLRNLHLTNSGSSHNDLDLGVQVRGKFNVISDNRIDNALFGVDLQQAENNIVRRNHISSKPVDLGVRGDAIRLWYSFNNQVTDNIIRDARNTVVWYSRDNLIAYNGIGIRFINDWQGNVLTGNRFKGNATQVVVEGGKTANRNTWDGNYWDDYEGFHRNDDGVGDSPHAIQAFADRLWMDVPPAQFFAGSPMLEVIDFLARLAPNPNISPRA
ncbi:NosD domain-containing protein [Thiocapsa sp.]|uniref:NosD domain-containing protein n=1 Tax=Thiocapsa sp. TaxID=2024551 RepID=UPI0035948459